MKDLKKSPRKKLRIFVGIPIEEKHAIDIYKWTFGNIDNPPARLIKPKNLHLTIVPPWYEDNILNILDKLGKISGNVGKFEITFTEVAEGPTKGNPRLIWALGESPRELTDLYNIAHDLLGKRKEDRPYKLHLTLARFPNRVEVPKIDKTVNWIVEVKEIALFESKLSPLGAEYNIIRSFSFKKPEML